ncbi:MAG: hypothetical protein HXO34_11330, partial [Prevotella sp.]|nr:hypothetical protein [Prevotella sp.]
YAYLRYRYRLSSCLAFYAVLHLTIGILVFLCVRSDNDWLRWGVASLLCVVSTLFSLGVMKARRILIQN